MSRLCTWKPEQHGYWPIKYHPLALELALALHPRNPKYARMLAQLCLICGARTRDA